MLTIFLFFLNKKNNQRLNFKPQLLYISWFYGFKLISFYANILPPIIFIVKIQFFCNWYLYGLIFLVRIYVVKHNNIIIYNGFAFLIKRTDFKNSFEMDKQKLQSNATQRTRCSIWWCDQKWASKVVGKNQNKTTAT